MPSTLTTDCYWYLIILLLVCARVATFPSLMARSKSDSVTLMMHPLTSVVVAGDCDQITKLEGFEGVLGGEESMEIEKIEVKTSSHIEVPAS